MPALREEMLPAADLDLAPTPGDVRQSMGSMPQLRGTDTPGQDEEFYGNEADDFVPDNYMDDSAMGAGQLEEEALPPADMSLGDAASGRPSVRTACGYAKRRASAGVTHARVPVAVLPPLPLPRC